MRTNDIVTIVVVIVAILLPCYLVYALGMYVQRRLTNTNLAHTAIKKVSWSEVAWMSCFVLSMLIGVATYKLAPESTVGSFLGRWFSSWYGWLTIPVAAYILGAAGALIGILYRVAKDKKFE